MLILAIETSTDAASCALWRDGRVDERACPGDRPSSETLLPTLAALLEGAGVGLGEIDGLAFGAGPGSFTGLRIACGVAQGIARVHDIPVLPVDTLAAVAEASGAPRVLVVLDARMREVYSRCFERSGDELKGLGDATVSLPAAIEFPGPDWAVCGNALTAYPELRERCAAAAAMRPEMVPTAAAVAVLGARDFTAGRGIGAAQAVPTYVRDKVALTVAERLAAGGRA